MMAGIRTPYDVTADKNDVILWSEEKVFYSVQNNFAVN